MQRRSPPKHRHDGTSPLPLGMDWSPPPRRWDGRDTVWPHDSRSGWSYCVTIPSWVVLPKSKDSDPVVFYRVSIGVQSPEGITTTRGVLRRFNDFLKLFADLKRVFPKKNLPSTPPKGLLRMKSRALLEERRCSLEEWMTKLLSDIDISRSVVVASFLELEAAARSSFQEVTPLTSEANAHELPTHSSLPTTVGCSSVTSDYGSDTAYEISDLGTPRLGRDDSSEIGNGMELFSEAEINKVINHARKLSNESEGSDVSSLRGSEMSNSGIPNSSGDCSIDLLGGAEGSSSTEILGNSELHTSGGSQIILPLDQRHKMNRVLVTMQRRLVTAKTDMEDLIARLNQEMAVKDYLATKVKDLEVELATDRQKSKENLQQAILIERERYTQMQWDMEELRRKSMEMELKLKSNLEKDEKPCAESTTNPSIQDKDILLLELDSSKEQLQNLLKQYEELETKSKADRKVLVKEVKSLRSSLQEKSEVEKLLEEEKQKNKWSENARKKLLFEYKILHDRLQEYNLSFPTEDKDKLMWYSSSLAEASDLLTTSDDQISLLLGEVELLAKDGGASSDIDEDRHTIDDNTMTTDDELRKMLTAIFVDNVRLRKQVNSVVRHALKLEISSTDNEALPKKNCEMSSYPS